MKSLSIRHKKDFNESMMKKAEAIRCRRFESIVNERYDFLDKEKMKGDFLAYFRNMLHKKNEKWKFVYTHFCIFVDYKCTFEEVTVDLCRNFGEYLLSAKKLKHQKYQRKLGKKFCSWLFFNLSRSSQNCLSRQNDTRKCKRLSRKNRDRRHPQGISDIGRSEKG